MKTALITGATRGIGYDLAKIFAMESHNLVLVSRNEQKLRDIQYDFSVRYKIDVHIIAKDLSKDHAATQIFKEVMDKKISVDVLINNAGVGDFSLFSDEDLGRITRMLHLNIVSLTELTRLFIPQMVERKEGRIMNVSSLAAFLPGPYMAVYYASKAYVKSFSEAIANELKDTGVTVTALCPGLTKTGFQENVGGEKTRMARMNLLASSESVAKYAYKAMYEGKEVAVPGIINNSIAMTSRIIPAKIKSSVIRMIQELNRKKVF